MVHKAAYVYSFIALNHSHPKPFADTSSEQKALDRQPAPVPIKIAAVPTQMARRYSKFNAS